MTYGTYQMVFSLPGYTDPEAGQSLSIIGGEAIRVHRHLVPASVPAEPTR